MSNRQQLKKDLKTICEADKKTVKALDEGIVKEVVQDIRQLADEADRGEQNGE